jgi:hypothetical protein
MTIHVSLGTRERVWQSEVRSTFCVVQECVGVMTKTVGREGEGGEEEAR